jgi:hypothetical protein
MPYFGISAKTGENIEELFYKIAEMLEQQEMEKHRKLKQTYSDEYDHPPATVESLTRSETKECTIKIEEEREKVSLVSKPAVHSCKC